MTELKYKVGDVVSYEMQVIGQQSIQEGTITEIDAEDAEIIGLVQKEMPVKKQKIYVTLGGAPNLLEETIIGVYNTKINSARAALQWISKQGEEYRPCLWGQQRKIDMVKDKSLKLWELSQSLNNRSILAHFRQGKSVGNGYHWVRIVESNLN